MEKTIGFIGAGNMASAIIGGMLSQKVTAPENISVFDPVSYTHLDVYKRQRWSRLLLKSAASSSRAG